MSAWAVGAEQLLSTELGVGIAWGAPGERAQLVRPLALVLLPPAGLEAGCWACRLPGLPQPSTQCPGEVSWAGRVCYKGLLR